MADGVVKIVAGRTGRLWEVILKQVRASLDKDRPCVLLVPELYTLQAERDLIEDLNLPGLLKVQVFSPSRLKNRVFERAGSDRKTFLDEQGQRIAVARAIESCRKELEFYKKAADKPGFIDAAAKWIALIKEKNISYKDLQLAADKTEQKSLSKKLYDLSLIYKEYEDFIALRGFTDAHDSDKDMISRIGRSGIMQNADCLVYGFDIISEPLQDLLISIAKEADSLLVTIVAEKSQEEDGDAFAIPLKSAQKLDKAFKDNNINAEFSFYEKPLQAPLDVQHLEKHFLSLKRNEYKKAPNSICLYLGQTPYKEAEFVAYTAKKYIQEGINPEDILIICANLNRYSAVLSNMLSSFGVPFYISEKTLFTSHDAIRAVLASFDIITDGFRMEDIITYASTGYSGLTQEESWRIENYAKAYGINGSLWRKPFERGDEEQRAKTEPIRKKLIKPLENLKENMSLAGNIQEFLEALINFLIDIDMPIRLDEQEQIMLDAGLDAAADTVRQIYKKLTESFEQMELLLENETMSLRSFAMLLRSSFESCSLSSLPPKLGCVQVGELDKILPDFPKITFVMGLNDDALSDYDASVVSDSDIRLIESAMEKAAGFIKEENDRLKLLSLYNALSSPKQKLFISYALSDETGEAMEPLTQIASIKNNFPLLKEEGGVMSSVETCPPVAAEQALKAMPQKLNSETLDSVWVEAINFLRTDGRYKHKTEQLIEYWRGKELAQKLSAGRAERLFSLSSMSVSRLQDFAACPFRHFVKEGLRPEEKKEWKIEPKDKGNFYHAALEAFSKKAYKHANYPNISQQESDSLMEQAGEEILSEIKDLPFLDSDRSKTRARAFIRDCKQTAWTLTRGLQKSSFVIFKVELEFGKVGGLMPVMIKLKDGSTIYLTGKIDRLDACESAGEQYMRIIDYKTGSIRLSPEDIFAGLQLQLLIYLKAVSGEKSAVPAGVFYQRVVSSLIDETEESLEQEVLQNKKDAYLTMSGIALKDYDVFYLMDAGDPPLSLGKLFNKNESPAKGKMLASEEEMQWLMDFAVKKAEELAEQIKSGSISASPAVDKYGAGPCDYCDYAGICRKDPVTSAKRMRIKEPMSFEELIERIKQDRD